MMMIFSRVVVCMDLSLSLSLSLGFRLAVCGDVMDNGF
jgi:hypothetical protein